MNKKKSEKPSGEVLRQGRILLAGISEEALAVLEELAGMDVPVFQFRDRTTGMNLTGDAGVLALMAAVRDGERGLVQTVKKLRRFAKEYV